MRESKLINFTNMRLLIDEHPQLLEKSLVDLINGLEVIDDHIRFREHEYSSLCLRAWRGVTGESEQRQHIIDQNISASLDGIVNWLYALQEANIKSSVGIVKISKKLLETREALMVLKSRYIHLREAVDFLLEKIAEIDGKYSLLEKRIEYVNAGRLAEQHLSAVFDKWKARRLHAYPILARLYLVFDELYWGDFGNFLRNYTLENSELFRLINQAKDKAIVQLEQDWTDTYKSIGAHYSWQEDLLVRISEMDDMRKNTLAFLTNHVESLPAEEQPMIWILNHVATSSLASLETIKRNRNVPRILDPENAVNRFALEFEARYESSRS